MEMLGGAFSGGKSSRTRGVGGRRGFLFPRLSLSISFSKT